MEILSLLLGKSKDNKPRWLLTHDVGKSLEQDLENLALSDDGGEADTIGQRKVAVETGAETSDSWIYLDKPKRSLHENSLSEGRLVRDHYNVRTPLPLDGNLVALLHLVNTI